jgi:hypothetical protein
MKIKEFAEHISPDGVKTNMNPKDDDYHINYGPGGLVAPFRKSHHLDVKTGSKKVQEEQLDEISPAQKQRIDALKEIGQKMKDVNNIFITGQKMKDNVLIAGARQKLAQLAKQKHDLEIQPVDESIIDESRQRDVVNELIAEFGDKYSENTIIQMVRYLIAGGEAFSKGMKYYYLCKATCDKMGFHCDESVEDISIGGIKAKPVAGPGSTYGKEQVSEIFADQDAGSGASNEADEIDDPVYTDLYKKIKYIFEESGLDRSFKSLWRLSKGSRLDAMYIIKQYVPVWFAKAPNDTYETAFDNVIADLYGDGVEIDWLIENKNILEDASAGATGSASVATVVSGMPGIIKRTGGKKKGRYGNSVTPKTLSAVGKGIYEAEKKN